MPNFSLLPQTATLVALATQTTTGTSAALTLPLASSYRFVFQVQTVSGTSPTLQVALATSLDAGTTYNEFLITSQMTASGAGTQVLFRPYLGIGDVATIAACPLVGTADFGTSAVVNNGPINPQFIKVRWLLTGTSPSFAFQVQYAAVPQDLSD